MTSHAFLDEEAAKRLGIFADIFRCDGKMQAIIDDGEIAHAMAINGIVKPMVQAGDHHKVIMFSERTWSWLVVIYSGFEAGNGLGALKIDRAYLRRQFCPVGVFNQERAQKIVNGLLAVMQVNPQDVDFDWGGLDSKGDKEKEQRKNGA